MTLDCFAEPMAFGRLARLVFKGFGLVPSSHGSRSAARRRSSSVVSVVTASRSSAAAMLVQMLRFCETSSSLPLEVLIQGRSHRSR